GANLADANGNDDSGSSYVVFGGASVGTAGTLNLSALNGLNGFRLQGAARNDISGGSVSSAGDVNGDGFDDLIVGAIGVDKSTSARDAGFGASYVVFGGSSVGTAGTLNLSALNGLNGFRLLGVTLRDLSGNSVSSAGDVNGDGFDDLIVGARYADANGNADSGASYVVFGAPSVGTAGNLNLSALNGVNGFRLFGVAAGDLSGDSVSSAGDVNGDGFDDLIVGATGADANGNSNPGASYVVFGAPSVGTAGTLNLSALNGLNGFRLLGAAANDISGTSVSSAGDVNGDGFDDLIVGASGANANGRYNSGASYVVFGGASVGTAGNLNLSALNGLNGFRLLGAA
ncbi:MAG: integrin alpha, partial [Pseudomonadota bacterium]